MTSPFLQRPAADRVAENALAFALRDGFPVSPGHTLVIPKRLVVTWFDATREEQHALLELVDEVKRQLDAELQPDGYNVGFNVGAAACGGEVVFTGGASTKYDEQGNSQQKHRGTLNAARA